MFRPPLAAWLTGLGLLATWTAATPARGQVVPDVRQRSGMITRSMPILPHLPPDPDRDTYYNTFWDDHPPKEGRVNSCKHGGLYGVLLKNGCTRCCPPSFWGSGGIDTVGPECRPSHRAARLVTNFFHPFRPVGHYYAGGCYVPIYDLDPVVTGPGPFPIGVFKKPHDGG